MIRRIDRASSQNKMLIERLVLGRLMEIPIIIRSSIKDRGRKNPIRIFGLKQNFTVGTETETWRFLGFSRRDRSESCRVRIVRHKRRHEGLLSTIHAV